jgi:hypothetical protein
MLSSFDSAISPLAFVIVSPAIYIIVRYFLASRRPNGFPRGPPTVPFLGNLHQLPRSQFFLQYSIPTSTLTYPLPYACSSIYTNTFTRFHRWRKDYGDIIGLKFGSKNVVILNNYKHVTEYITQSIMYARIKVILTRWRI